MFDLKSYLEYRMGQLEKILSERKKSLSGAPKGKLVAENRPKRPIYYLDGEPPLNKRKYIRKGQLNLAKKLAQRDYDRSVSEAAANELRAIGRMIKDMPRISAEEIYSTLSHARKDLVTPIRLPDDMFTRSWEEEMYEKKNIGNCQNEIFTLKGEQVRSKSEKIIADLLYSKDIPYRYEAALELKDFMTIYPDFTCLCICERREKYIEHLGMMDDPEYATNAIKRIADYETSGYYLGESLFISYETGSMPLNTRLLGKKIDQFFGI